MKCSTVKCFDDPHAARAAIGLTDEAERPMAARASARGGSVHAPGSGRRSSPARAAPPGRPDADRGRRRARHPGARHDPRGPGLAALDRQAGTRQPGADARHRARPHADGGDQARPSREPLQEHRRRDLHRGRRLDARLDRPRGLPRRGRAERGRAADRARPAGRRPDHHRRQRSGRRLRLVHRAGRAEAPVRRAADGHVHRLPSGP